MGQAEGNVMCQAAELELNLPQQQKPLLEGMEMQSTQIQQEVTPVSTTPSNLIIPCLHVRKSIRQEGLYGQDHTLKLLGFHLSLVSYVCYLP